VRTNEEINQCKCVMKREMGKNQVLTLAHISVKVIYDSNQIKVTIYINTVVASEDTQRQWSC
jgi:hypothetical protein